MIYNKNKFIHIESAASTNTYLKELCQISDIEDGTVIYTHAQTAGRGQRGNRWESEPGQNITMSLLIKPTHIPASGQFLLSQIVSLGVTDVLSEYAPGFSIKWPNDIYWKDKKIAGILIENTLQGEIYSQAIIGIGLNVNQQEFISDAPNPVSLRQITGKSYDIGKLLHKIVYAIALRYESSKKEINSLRKDYSGQLFRHTGYYPYESKGEIFKACITKIEDSGLMVLKTETGEERRYAFKEVSFLL